MISILINKQFYFIIYIHKPNVNYAKKHFLSKKDLSDIFNIKNIYFRDGIRKSFRKLFRYTRTPICYIHLMSFFQCIYTQPISTIFGKNLIVSKYVNLLSFLIRNKEFIMTCNLQLRIDSGDRK